MISNWLRGDGKEGPKKESQLLFSVDKTELGLWLFIQSMCTHYTFCFFLISDERNKHQTLSTAPKYKNRKNLEPKGGWPVRQTGHFSYKKVRGKPNAGLAPIMACPRGYAWSHREPVLISQKSEKGVISFVHKFSRVVSNLGWCLIVDDHPYPAACWAHGPYT